MMGRGFGYGAAQAGSRLGGYGRMGGGFARHGFFMGGGLGVILALIVVGVMVFAFWKIIEKTGHHGALSLLMLIPFVNVGIIVWLALTEWPVHKELASWRTWYASTQTPAAAVAEPVAVAAPVVEPEPVVTAPPVVETAPEPPVKKTKK